MLRKIANHVAQIGFGKIGEPRTNFAYEFCKPSRQRIVNIRIEPEDVSPDNEALAGKP